MARIFYSRPPTPTGHDPPTAPSWPSGSLVALLPLVASPPWRRSAPLPWWRCPRAAAPEAPGPARLPVVPVGEPASLPGASAHGAHGDLLLARRPSSGRDRCRAAGSSRCRGSADLEPETAEATPEQTATRRPARGRAGALAASTAPRLHVPELIGPAGGPLVPRPARADPLRRGRIPPRTVQFARRPPKTDRQKGDIHASIAPLALALSLFAAPAALAADCAGHAARPPAARRRRARRPPTRSATPPPARTARSAPPSRRRSAPPRPGRRPRRRPPRRAEPDLPESRCQGPGTSVPGPLRLETTRNEALAPAAWRSIVASGRCRSGREAFAPDAPENAQSDFTTSHPAVARRNEMARVTALLAAAPGLAMLLSAHPGLGPAEYAPWTPSASAITRAPSPPTGRP